MRSDFQSFTSAGRGNRRPSTDAKPVQRRGPFAGRAAKAGTRAAAWGASRFSLRGVAVLQTRLRDYIWDPKTLPDLGSLA